MDRMDENLEADLYQKKIEKERRKREKKGYFFSGLMVGLGSALLVICAVLLVTQIQKIFPGGVKQNGTTGSGTAEDGETVVSTEMIRKLQMIEKMIKKNYYKDEDIDPEEMEAGIYDGLIGSLGDIYADYYTPEELSDLMDQTEGIYYGIGAGVTLDTVTAYPKITKVYSGTPAEEAGLRENDIIYEVGGVTTYGESLEDVVSRIKGDEGTWVNLTIYREGAPDYLSIDVQRRKVSTPTAEFEMLDDKIAYIQLVEFDDNTVDQFEKALAQARAEGMQGLILDLRSNPGGSLSSVVEICRRILPKGLIVYTEDKYGKKNEFSCDGSKQLEVPLVVLINGNSASASEILAGAVKDYGIGTLVGTTTYGKGIVQSVMPMTDGSAVKLTISSYFTPKGNNIHGIGVEPDIVCEFDAEAYYDDPDHPDNQLEKAREVLREQMEK